MKKFKLKLGATVGLVALATAGFAQIAKQRDVGSSHFAPRPTHALLNINNFTVWIRDDGGSNFPPVGDNSAYFPRGTGNVIFADGVFWGGKPYLDSAKTRLARNYPSPFRIGGSVYFSSTRPGRILGFGANAGPADPNAPASRLYRIRRDYFFMPEKILRQDAAEVNGVKPQRVTAAQMQAVKAQYAEDWITWPVQFGAPFIDRNGNAKYDPPPPFSPEFTPEDLIKGNYDEPGLADAAGEAPADQVIWTVYNDLDRTVSLSFLGSEPLGLEIQMTQWGYKSDGPLNQTFFKRARIINKGGVALDSAGAKGAFWVDSMYVALFSDLDIGVLGDDLVGCDTLLSLGYGYNASAIDSVFYKFNLLPPAVGYVLLQGPKVRFKGEVSWFDFKKIRNWRNLPLSSFGHLSAGTPIQENGNERYWRMYHLLRGYFPDSFGSIDRLYPFPPGMTPNRFPFSGDPVRRTGFIDGIGIDYSYAAGDRRIFLSNGPLTLAPGDTQEVVYAFIAGSGGDRLSSITHLKFLARQVRYAYPYLSNLVQGKGYEPPDPILPKGFKLSRNYPNPFNGLTRISYEIPQNAEVRLAIYDVLGREIVVLEENRQTAGFYNTFWDGRTREGRELPSGVYIYRLQAGSVLLTKKLLLLH